MIAMRFISGFFGGALIPMSMYIILITLPAAKRPIAFMFWGIAIAVAPSLGPVLGGWLTEEISWKFVFYVQLIPSTGVFLALFYCLDSSPRHLGLLKQVNWLSIAFMAMGFAVMALYALRQPGIGRVVERYGDRVTPFILLLVGGYVLLNTGTDLMPG